MARAQRVQRTDISTGISPLDKTMEPSSGHGIWAYQIPPGRRISQYKNDRQTVLGVVALNSIPTEG
jgi:hypothetical protein